MVKTAWALLICALASISCGGSSDDAPAKCDAFETKVCTRLAECSPGGQTQENCVATLDMIFHCATAGGVKDTYAACLGAVDSIACTDLVGQSGTNLPQACSGVILPGS